MAATFAALAELANALSAAGHMVTQIHCQSDEAPESWAYGDHGAHVHAMAAADMVVTSDGKRWSMGGRNEGGEQ